MAKLNKIAKGLIILGINAACVSRAIAASDDLCNHLRTLEASPLATADDGKAVRRWVEFRWWGQWMVGGGSGCRHSPDQVAAATCAYLMENTSREFRASLPLRVLSCYGYSFPKFPQYDWDDWTGVVKLHGQKSDRQMTMEVDLTGRKSPASTVRISVVPDNPSIADGEPPPLSPSDVPTG